MPLSNTVERELLHTRSITLKGYRRVDGLFDIEGYLLDRKTSDAIRPGVTRVAGEPIHEMWLRITVNLDLVIVDAEAQMDSLPYAGACDLITPEYKKLIGVSLRPGFSAKVRALFGGTRGCTHITELIGAVATTAYQTMSADLRLASLARSEDVRPFQLDGCHALKTTGPVVEKFYPRWYRIDDIAKSADVADVAEAASNGGRAGHAPGIAG
jgi:hypothetical protein